MSVELFIENFNGGTRKNRFRVLGKIPPSGDFTALNFDDYHVEATTFPASILTENPIDYQGRKIYYPGDRIYGEGVNLWSVSFLDDKNSGGSSLFNTFWGCLHNWHNTINDHIGNDGNSQLFANIEVRQLNLNDRGLPAAKPYLKNASLFDCWPQAVGPIKFEMQARDQYARFDVTFCFKYAKYDLPL
jgi:hypothetical protein